MSAIESESCVFCLRVDVDTVRDIESLPFILDELERNHLKATFFVATGKDDSARRIHRAITNALRGRYWRRYGVKNLRRLIISEDIEAQLHGYRRILDEGHEMALHGFHHIRWLADANKWKIGELRRNFVEGLRRFRSSFGVEPKGFASPGFNSNDRLDEILSENDFMYRSDFRGTKRPSPILSDGVSGLMEMPVSGYNIEELVLQGDSLNEAVTRVKAELDGGLEGLGYASYYLHPSFAEHVCRDDLKVILSHIGNKRNVKSTTMVDACNIFSTRQREPFGNAEDPSGL